MPQAISVAVWSGTTIGLDLGDRYTHFTTVDSDGEVVDRGRVKTAPRHLERFLRSSARSRLVLEAGSQSAWISRVGSECGHEVIVANPRCLPLISKLNNKTDRRDSELLARLGRVDPQLLAPIQHRGEAAQADLVVVRTREAIVRARTALINHVRGTVKSFGSPIPKGIGTDAFAAKAGEFFPSLLRDALEGTITAIGIMTAQIRQYDRTIGQMLRKRYPEAQRLSQIQGVGPITSVTYVLTIEDPGRFRRSRDVAPYLGLVPRRSSSGHRDPELRITKAGDKLLRCLLVQCAQYILNHGNVDSDLKRWGLGLAARGKKNAKKRALVAMARKLAVLLHRLWVSGAPYEPLRNALGVDGAAA